MRQLWLLIVIALLAGATLPATAAEPTVIRIGTPDSGAGQTPSAGINLSTYLDQNKLLDKEFAKDGIRIEWTYFKGAGPAVNEALASKQLDFAFLGDLAGIIGRAAGLDTRYLAATRGGNAYLAVAPDSGISKLADLKGKRVTVLKGTAYELSLDKALASVGLSEQDMHVTNLTWDAAMAALAAKQLDADYGTVTVLTLRDKGLAKVPLTTRDFGRAATFQSGLLARGDFLSSYPDIAQRVVNVVVGAQYWLSQQEHLDKFITDASARSGIPAALGHAEYDNDDMKFRFSPRIDDFILDSYQSSIDKAKQLGLIRAGFDARAWADPELVDKAIAAQKLQGFWPNYDQAGHGPS